MRNSRLKALATVVCIVATVFCATGVLPFSPVPCVSPGVAEAAVFSLESVINILASVGGAGAVVVVVAATTGLAGAAALVAALSLMGGPFGMLGGIFATAGIAVLTYNISRHGMGFVMEKLAQKWKEEGKSLEEIEADIDGISDWIASEATKEDTKRAIRGYMQ